MEVKTISVQPRGLGPNLPVGKLCVSAVKTTCLSPCCCWKQLGRVESSGRRNLTFFPWIALQTQSLYTLFFPPKIHANPTRVQGIPRLHPKISSAQGIANLLLSQNLRTLLGLEDA